MVSTSDCAKADEVDLVGRLSPVIGVGEEEDIVAGLVEWPHLKGARVEYLMGCSRFREFCKAKGSVDGIWGHAFGYRDNFFRTCNVRQGEDYLYLLPDLAKEKICRRLGDEVSLEYIQGVVKESRTDGFCCYLAQFDYGLTLPLSNLAKSVMNMIGACPAQLNCNFWEVILVCETLNERWTASSSESRITAKDFLEYYAVKYVTRSDEEPLKLNNITITKGISCKVSRKESFIDSVAKEGTELEVVLKKLGINRFKRVASKDDKVRRSQAKRRMAGKTPGSMEEKMLTPELNTPLKLARLNEMPDGQVDMATVSSIVVQNLAKWKAVKRGAASRSTTSDSVDNSTKRRKGADLRPRFEVETGLMEKQCRAKAREKGVTVVEDEFKKDRSIELERRISHLEGEKNQFEGSLTWEREAFELELEKEKEAAALKLKEVRAESVAEAERLVSASATSRNIHARKLYQLRYSKADILAFNEWNNEVKEIVDEEEGEEMEDGLNVAEKTVVDNQETIDQEIKSLRLRVVDLEGLLEVEKNSSADFQLISWPVGQGGTGSLELADVCFASLPVFFCRSVFELEEYEALISLYEDQLDDNVKLSLKLEEAKSQVEDKTTTLLGKDLAMNQLISELAELKKSAASGSRHDAELAEYRIRALNDEISDMKCNIRALNEQLLKREIDLDTVRTNLVVSEADFEKFSNSIVGKNLELRNSTQILDSLIARLDHLKTNLRHLKERNAKSRANLAEVQAKKKNLVDDLAHVCGNVRRAVQRDKEMNERINQLCARITELERELRVRERKYKKDLKLELDKRDGEIAYGEGSREMKEFLRQKEELVENMRIDLTNSRQKLIDLTRQMSERIDQLTGELAESKAHRLRDNKRATVTHQSFKELVVHEQDKCDGEALHQRQLSALVAFFVEEIKFIQVERDLVQDCFFGRTCVSKLDISSIDSIGVMDRGIGTTTAEKIARGREIVAERAPEYMAFRTEIGGSSSAVSPTPTVGGRSTATPSRKSSRIKKKK
ncbi:hypothetical protein GIB67_040628 [Kingdonia uniflora]|uniref:Uncharacterized protein n=1 Tax=Kingdonia uniflora TaxID=39325 RepID=A0A7J7M8Z7_9MAGN|nr:hypothetical protein GIB67_040628 [Kingdonia uniflora]